MKKFTQFLRNRVEIPNWWLFILLFLALSNLFFIFYYLSKISFL